MTHNRHEPLGHLQNFAFALFYALHLTEWANSYAQSEKKAQKIVHCVDSKINSKRLCVSKFRKNGKSIPIYLGFTPTYVVLTQCFEI